MRRMFGLVTLCLTLAGCGGAPSNPADSSPPDAGAARITAADVPRLRPAGPGDARRGEMWERPLTDEDVQRWLEAKTRVLEAGLEAASDPEAMKSYQDKEALSARFGLGEPWFQAVEVRIGQAVALLDKGPGVAPSDKQADMELARKFEAELAKIKQKQVEVIRALAHKDK